LLLRFLGSSDALLAQRRLQPFELRGRHLVGWFVSRLSRPTPLDLELFLESKSEPTKSGVSGTAAAPHLFSANKHEKHQVLHHAIP
jgi:hypothetical protein